MEPSGGTPSRAELFLRHLDRITGGVEPRFHRVRADAPPGRGITTITYDDLPEPGLLTGLTYGLSLAEHPDWRLGKPELCITVASDDDGWVHAVGHLADQLQGSCPFSYGNAIDFGERISPESAMTAFLGFAPAVLSRAEFVGIDVGDPLPISISGCYPIHDSEREYVHSHGLEAFWQLDWEPLDVTRPPVV